MSRPAVGMDSALRRLTHWGLAVAVNQPAVVAPCGIHEALTQEVSVVAHEVATLGGLRSHCPSRALRKRYREAVEITIDLLDRVDASSRAPALPDLAAQALECRSKLTAILLEVMCAQEGREGET